KTATFTLLGSNLVFQSTLPYGSSNIAFSAEDPDDPQITYTLTANILVHDAYYGLYAGSHTVQAMGSSVTYNYTVSLGAGLKYSFVSHYSMGETVYSHNETGTWNISGQTFTLTPDGEDEIAGTIVDGVISTSIKASHMASSRTETTLTYATHAAYAGNFLGKKVSFMYTANVSLELDMFGGYTYTSDVGQPESYVETGQYEMSGTTLTLTPEEGDAYTATLQNHVLTGNFRVIGGMPGTDLTFYNAKIQGTFVGSATHEEIEYTTTLILKADGTYDLTIVDDEDEVVVEATGAFVIMKTMMIMVILDDVTPQPSIALASDGLNFSMLLPGMDEGGSMGGLGFFLSK
ncbi:MAG: hypothetical protein RG740_07595, partial [Acholeplasmataceae bacterium]|nr:hypothetical protein [Acholeplasmataceae bacterium]